MKRLLSVWLLFQFYLSYYCNGHDLQIKRSPKQLWNETYLDKLRNDLLTNYDKYARPEQHYEVTTVKINLIFFLLSVDEANSTFTVSALIELTWNDSKLKWNPDDYGGTNTVRLDDHEIWTPNIYLFNSASFNADPVNHYQSVYAMVYPEGSVIWVPPAKLKALCEFDLYYWPFDTQNCYLKLVSWTRNGQDIKFELKDLYNADEFEATVSESITAWDVSSTAEVYTDFKECCTNSFYVAQFNITMQRKSSAYVAVVITPAIAVVILLLAQCWLPFYSGQRIILNCCTAIMITLLATHYMNKIYSIGQKTPLLLSFYSTSLFITCFSIMESIIIQLLVNTYVAPLPGFVSKILKSKLGKILLLDNTCGTQLAMTSPTVEELKDDHVMEDEDKEEECEKIIVLPTISHSSPKMEWDIFLMALDRVSFVVYVCVYLVLALLCVI